VEVPQETQKDNPYKCK